jgi:YjbE family integral membrane protein
MDISDAPGWLLIPVQILFVDLLLGADNALVIALACRSLPPQDVRRATTIGIAGAIAMRLAMTMMTTSLLAIPLVKLIGALALVLIAMNICEGEGLEAPPRLARRDAEANLWAAAAVIVVADAAMGMDNVVALAAIARGNFWLLAIGVGFSLPVLGYGGVLLTGVLKRAPGLVLFGAALLGWIAGGMAISDPLVSAWADSNAPGLEAIAPALGAAFVFFYGRSASRAPSARPARAAEPAARAWTPAPLPAPPPARLEPSGDRLPEPEGRVEPPKVPATTDDRVAIIGVLLLAIVAGAILMIASYIDSFN